MVATHRTVCGEHTGRHSVDSWSDQTQQQYTVDSRRRASPRYVPILGLTCWSDIHFSSLQLEVKCWFQSEGKHLQSDVWSLHSCVAKHLCCCAFGWAEERDFIFKWNSLYSSYCSDCQ